VFPAQNIAALKVSRLIERIGDKKVLLALSGGSDSSVVAYLLKGSVSGPGKIKGIYIRGIDRPDDEAFVHEYFSAQDWIDVEIVDATDAFLEALQR